MNQLAAFTFLVLYAVHEVSPFTFTPTSLPLSATKISRTGQSNFLSRRRCFGLRSDAGDGNDQEEFISFSDATAAIQQEEEDAKAKERGGGLSDKDRENYEARKDDIDEMRKRIQDRAKELGVTQTSNSVSSIGETQTSAAEAGRSSELDMSAFSKKEEDYVPKYMQAFSSGKEGRELTDEEKLNADPYANLNILAAMWEESKLIEWPKPAQVVKQALVTAISLVLSVAFIVTLDSTIKVVYQGIGLYPK
ncbi:hypothetical protein TrLO_g15906 [Triparma laevis f. longispina]|uniref:Uncharacterized protein n=1 Tax=Triparma laevis f. longispina TaxID=1714387 RepID=A0A9W6ZZN2_9STRA|nr:hypothetical protein TrLO_g15906 [Triparma laevis f. longispina]